MPAVHEFGSRFYHFMQYPTRKFPLIERGTTRETDHPFRTGSSVVVRCPGTRRAVVIGKWMNAGGDEMSVLLNALSARELGEYREWDG